MGIASKKTTQGKSKNKVQHNSKVEKQKAKHDTLIKKLQNKKVIKKPILDMSALAEPLPKESKEVVKKEVVVKSTKGKKYQLEREKSRFQKIIQDPIYQANPTGAVLAYLEHIKNNKKQ